VVKGEISEMPIEESDHISVSAIGSRRRLLPVTCVLLAIHALLLFFADSIPSHELLFLFFFLTLVMLPGFIATSILFPAARFYFKLFLSILLGTVPIFVLLLIFSIPDLNIFHVSWMIPVFCIGLATYNDYGSFGGFAFPNNQALSRPAVILMITILAIVSVITLVVRDPVLYTVDSPDHMAYIRAITRSHEVFPSQFIYRDGGMLTRDIRRGLLHAMWGTINTATSRIAVLPVWPLVSWIGSIFLLLGIFCLGVQLFRSQSIGLWGVILYLLFYQRGFAGHQLFVNAYGFYFAKVYLFAFLAFVILYIRTVRREFLFMAAASSFAAIGTHVSYIMILLFIAFVLWIMEWFQHGRKSGNRHLVGRLVPLFGSIIVVNLPYLLLRYFRDYDPVNEIHTHSQGTLFFTEKLAVVNPILFFQLSGHLMVAALFAVVLLWNRSRNDRNLRSTLGLVAGVYILAFNPLFVPFIMEKITYLIVRFSAAAPNMLVVAYLIHSILRGIKGRNRTISRARMAIGSLLMLGILVPGLVLNFNSFAYGGKTRHINEKRSCLDLNDLYSFINSNLPDGGIIASDPITSYGLLAFTDQYVVCTYDQHSTPNDSSAIERIFACRNIYLPGFPCIKKIQTLEEYDADYVVINGRIPSLVRSQYWTPDREYAEATARMLSQCSEFFDLIYSEESLYLFEYTGTADTDSSEMIDSGREQPSYFLEEFTGDFERLTKSGTDGIYMRSWGTETGGISRGDTLRIFVDWVSSKRMEPGTYDIYVRFDTGFEKGPLYSFHYGKIYRKMLEKIRGETYRFRINVLPFRGIYPPDTWVPGSVMRQYIDVPIPGYIAEGLYTISVKMDNAPHYSNLSMKDLLRDDDFYDGPDLMEIIIE
jgi:hypothetical protein